MMPWDALGCSGMLWDAKSAVIWRLLGGREGGKRWMPHRWQHRRGDGAQFANFRLEGAGGGRRWQEVTGGGRGGSTHFNTFPAWLNRKQSEAAPSFGKRSNTMANRVEIDEYSVRILLLVSIPGEHVTAASFSPFSPSSSPSSSPSPTS